MATRDGQMIREADRTEAENPGVGTGGGPTVRPACVPELLIARARRGDQQAFDALFAAYQPALCRYVRSVARAHVDDVVAATWESVARSLPRFRGDGDDFRRWLFTIARRRLVDEVRRQSRWLVVAGAEEPEPEPPVDASLDEPSWAGRVLALIPTRQADAVALRVMGGLSVAETAEVLGVSEENVRVLCHRGLKAIEAILAQEGADVADAV